jgi:peptide-methionine (R)-S-oxide reductase
MTGPDQTDSDPYRKTLTEDQYAVCRQAATEAPFSGKYWNHKAKGCYRCVACDAALFDSGDKYDSGCGWPSFLQPVASDAVTEHEDLSHGMRRIEVRCAGCQSHLGHVFPDGPAPTGLRYCINSLALNFEAAG